MPTTLPRVNATFQPTTYDVLRRIAEDEGIPTSEVVERLVESALDLAEDLALGERGEQRLRTFSRDDAIASDEMLRWVGRRGRRR
jgi:hypothetical protein